MDEFQSLKRGDRRVMTLDDYTEADVAAREATRAPVESNAFDDELLCLTAEKRI